MHITYLQSEDMLVKINDIMSRVVRDNYEITMVYTYKLKNTENETVRDLDWLNHDIYLEILSPKKKTYKNTINISNFLVYVEMFNRC